MFDQKLLFKVMLWSLGLAAILGVAAVLTASLDVVGRVTATAFLTSAVAAVLWQASIRLERDPLAIKMAQSGAILFYVFALSGIWEIGNGEQVWGTAFVCLGGLSVAASGRALQTQADYRYMGLIVMAAAFVSSICWLTVLWSDGLDIELTITGFVIAGWSTAVAICVIGLGTQPSRHWRWIGVGAAVSGILLSEYSIFRLPNSQAINDTLTVLASIVFVVVHAVLCYASRSTPRRLTIRLVAIASTIITAALIDLIILGQLEGQSFLLRLTIAAAIVASASTIATAFLIQSAYNQSQAIGLIANNPPLPEPGPTAGYTTLRVECPQCLLWSTIPLGDSTCPHCSMRFKIEVSTSG